MSTPRAPHPALSLAPTLEQVRTQEPVAPRQLRVRVSRDLETICLRCLENDAAKRYPTAAALADDLLRFLDGQPSVTPTRIVRPAIVLGAFGIGAIWELVRRSPRQVLTPRVATPAPRR
jgi:hypothetical protein